MENTTKKIIATLLSVTMLLGGAVLSTSAAGGDQAPVDNTDCTIVDWGLAMGPDAASGQYAEVGFRISPTAPFNRFGLMMGTFGAQVSAALSIYEWDQDYATSVAGEAKVTKSFQFVNDSFAFVEFDTLPAHEYVIVIHDYSAASGSLFYQYVNANVKNVLVYGNGAFRENLNANIPAIRLTFTEEAADGVYFTKTWDESQYRKEYTLTLRSSDPEKGSVTGDGVFFEGNTVTAEATAAPGYAFENWTDKGGEIVSTLKKFTFKITEDMNLTANFTEVQPQVLSFMADGMTLPAVIDEETKTVRVTFASDVDLTRVRPYFYFEDEFEGKQPYEILDLSSGSADLGHGWTVLATQNPVMLNLYVDGTNGSDDNTGLTPKDAFASLQRAQEAVRSVESFTGDVLVHIAEGEYFLADTLEFDSRDSAEGGFSVVYRSQSGNAEDVVITGGVALSGWEPSDEVEGAWELDASDIPYSRDLFVDGKKAVIARTSQAQSIQPQGWTDIDDPEMQMTAQGYIASGSKGNLHTWRNPGDIEFVYEEAWTFCIIPVTDIKDNGDGTSRVTMHREAFTLGKNKAGRQIGDPNYIQNAFELLDEEGEWYFDRSAQKIYYIPLDGKDPNTQNIIMPVSDRLISVQGTEDDTVDGLAFRDLTFAYTSFIRPHTMGQVEIQANFVVDPDTGTKNNHDNFLKTPGAVTVAYAKGMRVEGCVFRNLSASGLDFEEGVTGSTIVGNTFRDVGASGIQVGGVSVRDAQPFSEVTYVNGKLIRNAGQDPERVTEQILVMSNTLENIGAEYNGSIGIFVGYGRDITVAHNDISNTPYTAISAGWGWGYWDEGGRSDSPYYTFDTPTVMERYVIENNRISKVCQRLADGGSIYTLSLMPGSVIRGNVMDDCRIAFGGIYLDEGSGGFVAIENNVATETVYQPYFYHLVANYTDREAECAAVMQNNYFKTGSAEDENYRKILDTAGVLPAAEDRALGLTAATGIAGGTVALSAESARAGEIVTVTVTANEGYLLKELTSASGKVIFFEDNGVFKMIMSGEAEVIGAVFVSESDVGETDETDRAAGTAEETTEGKDAAGCRSAIGSSIGSSMGSAAAAAAMAMAGAAAVVLKKKEKENE